MISEQEESASASAASGTGSAAASQYPVHSLPIEGCVYRGEGNANLVVALPSEQQQVIRLRKSSPGEALEDEAAALRRVRREVDFIRGVISGFLGCYVRAPEILRCEAQEIARLADKIRPQRPENRRDKEIIGGFATKYPDYTFLPKELGPYSSEPTFCVEIKPKQGFICEADRQFQKCPYCLTQYYKVQQSCAKTMSAYCPLDLYSGQPERMARALEALLRSPQNNFKIFRNGQVVYDESLGTESSLQLLFAEWFSGDDPVRQFIELTRQALTRPFDAARKLEEPEEEMKMPDTLPSRLEPGLVARAKELLALLGQECELSEPGLAQGSVLERILRMQGLHRRGADAVAWMAAKLSASLAGDLDDELIYAPADAEIKVAINKVIRDEYLKKFTIHDCTQILKNYLLFCTARDCSVLMAFQKADKKLPPHVSFENEIHLSGNQSFLVSIKILDLDRKSLNCIEKHCRRDNEILKATIEEIEKKIKSKKK